LLTIVSITAGLSAFLPKDKIFVNDRRLRRYNVLSSNTGLYFVLKAGIVNLKNLTKNLRLTILYIFVASKFYKS